MMATTSADALTLPMLAGIALDELYLAATHRMPPARGPTGGPVFLGLVHTEGYWLASPRQPTIRRATMAIALGPLISLFDRRIDYDDLERLEVHLFAALWMLASDLLIVDGTSFVALATAKIPPPVCTAANSDVAVRLNIDRARGQLHVTAAVV